MTKSFHCGNCGSIFDFSKEEMDGPVFRNGQLECNVCHNPIAKIELLGPPGIEIHEVEPSVDCNYCNYLINPHGQYDPSKKYPGLPKDE